MFLTRAVAQGLYTGGEYVKSWCFPPDETHKAPQDLEMGSRDAELFSEAPANLIEYEESPPQKNIAVSVIKAFTYIMLSLILAMRIFRGLYSGVDNSYYVDKMDDQTGEAFFQGFFYTVFGLVGVEGIYATISILKELFVNGNDSYVTNAHRPTEFLEIISGAYFVLDFAQNPSGNTPTNNQTKEIMLACSLALGIALSFSGYRGGSSLLARGTGHFSGSAYSIPDENTEVSFRDRVGYTLLRCFIHPLHTVVLAATLMQELTFLFEVYSFSQINAAKISFPIAALYAVVHERAKYCRWSQEFPPDTILIHHLEGAFYAFTNLSLAFVASAFYLTLSIDIFGNQANNQALQSNPTQLVEKVMLPSFFFALIAAVTSHHEYQRHFSNFVQARAQKERSAYVPNATSAKNIVDAIGGVGLFSEKRELTYLDKLTRHHTIQPDLPEAGIEKKHH